MFEVEYGCDVQNKFEDCAEASDPFELLSAKSKAVKASKRLPKGEKPANVEARPPAPVPPSKKESERPQPKAATVPEQFPRPTELVEQRGRGRGRPRRRVVDGRVSYDTVTFRRGGRGGRYEGGRSGFPPRQVHSEQQQQQQAELAEAGVPGSTGGLEELPRRPYRGGRMGASRADGSRRLFDRHSGSVRTGVRAEEKRRGGGAHNWGKASEVIEPSEVDYQQMDTSTADQTAAADEATGRDDTADKGSRSPSPVQMTLDEYREQQRRQRIEHKPEGRKAGEGEDPKRWAKPAVVYHKKPDENLKYRSAEKQYETTEEEETEEDETDEEDERTKLEKTVTSSMFVAKPAVIGTGGRRGRFEGYRDENRGEQQGRTRGVANLEIRRGGGGGRGQPRGGEYERRQQNAERPPDLSEFPELC